MSYTQNIFFFFCLSLVQSYVIDDLNSFNDNITDISENFVDFDNNIPENVFDGVYTECFLHLSYSCLQEKTLLYLEELNKLSEVSVLGEYVKFVKINETEDDRQFNESYDSAIDGQEDLTNLIDKAVDKFFNGHVLKFNAFGKDVTVPDSGKLGFAVENFVGRKRKGGGGGGGGHDHGDGGKKKMMMMAMMCMKMKLMIMVPAMMGMMGMMSFKGMMFSMMSFMVSKMMLLMKILEKKGLGGGGDGGGWAAGGGGAGGGGGYGGGGAWMPAGGQDYGGGGGGGGGYDANGQWQNRALIGINENGPIAEHDPIVAYIPPLVRTNHRRGDKLYSAVMKLNSNPVKTVPAESKSRKKRGIVEVLQNAYLYWLNKILGSKSQQVLPRYPKYKIINGVRYVYYPQQIYPIRYIKKPKQLNPQPDLQPINTPIVASDNFNKGEISEGQTQVVLSRKFNVEDTMDEIKKMVDDVNDVIEQDPWE